MGRRQENPQEDGGGAIFVAGLGAMSGAVVGFLLHGRFAIAGLLLLTSLFSIALGWWARGLVT